MRREWPSKRSLNRPNIRFSIETAANSELFAAKERRSRDRNAKSLAEGGQENRQRRVVALKVCAEITR